VGFSRRLRPSPALSSSISQDSRTRQTGSEGVIRLTRSRIRYTATRLRQIVLYVERMVADSVAVRSVSRISGPNRQPSTDFVSWCMWSPSLSQEWKVIEGGEIFRRRERVGEGGEPPSGARAGRAVVEPLHRPLLDGEGRSFALSPAFRASCPGQLALPNPVELFRTALSQCMGRRHSRAINNRVGAADTKRRQLLDVMNPLSVCVSICYNTREPVYRCNPGVKLLMSVGPLPLVSITLSIMFPHPDDFHRAAHPSVIRHPSSVLLLTQDDAAPTSIKATVSTRPAKL